MFYHSLCVRIFLGNSNWIRHSTAKDAELETFSGEYVRNRTLRPFYLCWSLVTLRSPFVKPVFHVLLKLPLQWETAFSFLPFGVARPPPPPPLYWLWSNQTNADTGARLWVSLPTYALYTGFLMKSTTQRCDTLCGRTGDICSLQTFLWRRIKTSAFLDLCACAGAAARDRVGEVYLTKHPQVHSILIHSRAIKRYFQDVRERMEREKRLKIFLAAHRQSMTLEKRDLPFKDETLAVLKPNEFAGILCLADWNESAQCLQQSIMQCEGKEFASSHVF